MSLDDGPTCRLRVRFPRVSGDEPPQEAAKVLAKAFSPRERG